MSLEEIRETLTEERIVISKKDEAMANAYSLLARCFTYPNDENFQIMSDGSLLEALVFSFDALLSEALISPLQESQIHDSLQHMSVYVNEGKHTWLYQELRVDYTGLYIGLPDPLVSPYESIHRGNMEGREALLFVDSVAQDALRAYRLAGLTRISESEPPDFIATELEFAYYLLISGDVAGFHRFNDEHLRKWIPVFAKETRENTGNEFYCGAATLLDILVTSG